MAKGDRIVKGGKPVIGPKKGATKPCGHDGCKMLLRYTLEGWKHSVRQPYDHKPVEKSESSR